MFLLLCLLEGLLLGFDGLFEWGVCEMLVVLCWRGVGVGGMVDEDVWFDDWVFGVGVFVFLVLG